MEPYCYAINILFDFMKRVILSQCYLIENPLNASEKIAFYKIQF